MSSTAPGSTYQRGDGLGVGIAFGVFIGLILALIVASCCSRPCFCKEQDEEERLEKQPPTPSATDHDSDVPSAALKKKPPDAWQSCSTVHLALLPKALTVEKGTEHSSHASSPSH
ncbi:hypothetical protein LshimejAT787_0101730 [Lyophyllum shimeji]|uniref:Uncharacterized protein n=1 Tax=Lyophyllum shimeji TaxID=47721 RepID=A0A9P3PCU4_LYOSH|nr:hypothetical protein LshimejAT787_0101730 [Lyophyllum shimeji]